MCHHSCTASRHSHEQHDLGEGNLLGQQSGGGGYQKAEQRAGSSKTQLHVVLITVYAVFCSHTSRVTEIAQTSDASSFCRSEQSSIAAGASSSAAQNKAIQCTMHVSHLIRHQLCSRNELLPGKYQQARKSFPSAFEGCGAGAIFSGACCDTLAICV